MNKQQGSKVGEQQQKRSETSQLHAVPLGSTFEVTGTALLSHGWSLTIYPLHPAGYILCPQHWPSEQIQTGKSPP